MTTTAKGSFQIKTWNEEPFREGAEGFKLTQASVTQSFQGDFDGEGVVEYLMAYREDGSANFVGMQHVTGSLGERLGTAALQVSGTYEGGTVRARWFVVPGTGTGGLRGLTGEGEFVAERGPRACFTLSYTFSE